MAQNDSAKDYCFGFLMLKSVCIILLISDLIIFSNSLIFTVTGLFGGENKYLDTYIFISDVIPFDALPFLLIAQILCLNFAIASFVSMKKVKPYLQLPYLLSTFLTISISIWLIIRTSNQLNESKSHWLIILILCISTMILLEQLYFLYIKFTCFKALIRKRRMVTSTTDRAEITAEKLEKLEVPPVHAAIDQLDTYSNKSTVIITD